MDDSPCVYVVALCKLYFLLYVAELGCVPGSHRDLHPGPCSVGHEGKLGNDSGL